MQIGSLQPYEMKQYEIAKLKDYSVNDLSECIKIWLFCSALSLLHLPFLIKRVEKQEPPTDTF